MTPGTPRPALVRTLWAIVLTVVLGPGLVLASGVVAPPPAQASGERLCVGYSGCGAGGYSDDGYAAQSQTYWWRMQLGHNCTAYAAYRMVRSGLANSRPWTGEGDAHVWGHRMAGITDQVPRVGAVAWWDAFAGGHGRLGHVAYVERVISPDEVVISQDVYHGDFSWARITRGSGGWPSGFIHFNDERLRVESRPRVSGRPRVDTPLRVSAGRWSASVDLSYQWLANGRRVRGATRTTFTPTARHAGDRLRVRVTARSSGLEPVVVTTGSTAPVGRGVLRVVRRAKVSGDAQVGRVVRLRLPRTAPGAARSHVRWRLDGRPLKGARGTRLELGPKAAGQRLSAVVRVHRRGYEPRKVTVRVGRVDHGLIRVRRAFRIAGRAQVGQSLRVVAGTYSPGEARTGYLWFRDREAIAGTRGTSTYVVQPEDVGHRIGLLVGIGREGYDNKLVGAVTAVVPAPTS